jgi:hypothetical protein
MTHLETQPAKPPANRQSCPVVDARTGFTPCRAIGLLRPWQASAQCALPAGHVGAHQAQGGQRWGSETH